MPLKDFARLVRDDLIPRERLRRSQRQATIGSGVKVMGEIGRIQLAEQVTIHGPTVISVEDGGGLGASVLRIGARTYIGEFNNIRCAGATLSIGADCLLSQFVSIVGSNHGIEQGKTIVSQHWAGQGVVIGDDVWIGAGATLLPGTRVGDGVVIAANSVVREIIPPGVIIGGTPSRVIGTRPSGVTRRGR